ncbi:MAG: PDZ domain-containing protein, partial [Acidaminococcaceae bacterium]
MKGLIAAVHRNSVAAATGITPGEKLCAVNGSDLQDIIELSYLLAEEKLDLLIEGLDAVTRHVLIEKM